MLDIEQAWTLIAVAFETPPEDRTELQGKMAGGGICFAACDLLEAKLISGEMCDYISGVALDEAERLHGPKHLPKFIHMCRCPEGDAIRAAFCRDQAGKLEGER